MLAARLADLRPDEVSLFKRLTTSKNAMQLTTSPAATPTTHPVAPQSLASAKTAAHDTRADTPPHRRSSPKAAAPWRAILATVRIIVKKPTNSQHQMRDLLPYSSPRIRPTPKATATTTTTMYATVTNPTRTVCSVTKRLHRAHPPSRIASVARSIPSRPQAVPSSNPGLRNRRAAATSAAARVPTTAATRIG